VDRPIAENRGMTSRKTSSEERKQRLAKALKRNIARRKAQARPPRVAAAATKPPPDDKGCPN
jgi:hypothetical protein